jgi:fused signal recognition particle receptor
MFKFFKKKLKNWTEKVSKTEEEKSESVKALEKVKEKIGKTPKATKAISIPKEIEIKKKEDLGKDLEEKEITQPGTKSFLEKVTSKIKKIKISEETFKIYSEELEMLLLENNVALEVSEKIIKELGEKIVGKEFLKKEVESEIRDSLKEIITEILVEPYDLIEKIKEKGEGQTKEPFVILFCGINGTGKTTTIAKIASFLKEKKIPAVLAAADTFRAASIEQIKIHADKIGVKVIAHDYGSDPASVGFDSIQYAKKNFIPVVLIDTAGRMHTAKNLMSQIEKISKVCKPDIKLFIGESIAGNDSIEQVKSFDWAIGIDGIILTKADVDEKGGTALSLGYVTKKPILFLGTGQDYDEIEVFDKEKFLKELGL